MKLRKVKSVDPAADNLEAMNARVLVCTDGSRLSMKGVREAVRLAKGLRGRMTGVYVIPPPPSAYGEPARYYAAGVTPAEFRRYMHKRAKAGLARAASIARKAHVRFTSRVVADLQPWKGILRAARAARCDLVVMASHGRSALGGLMLGSETMRVLARSKIPVLVVR